jgi:hypothetical protein
MKNSTMLE